MARYVPDFSIISPTMRFEAIDTIYNTASKFLLPLTIKETYRVIVNEATRLMDANQGSIFLANRSGTLKRVYSSYPRTKQIDPRKRGNAYFAFEKKKIIVVSREEFRTAHPELRKHIKSIILVPLINKNRSIGVIAIDSSKTKRFSINKLHIIRLFASIASLAIRKAQLYAQINEAIEARDLFISVAAHELKTPLTSINVYNELINRRTLKNKLPEKEWVEGMSSQIFRLTKLINEFLQVKKGSGVESALDLKTYDIKKIINSAYRNFQFKYPGRKLKIVDEVGDDPQTVIVDSDKIVQVFNNLLDNAVKFSPPKSVITITLKKRGHAISISVNDLGTGIKDKDFPNLFKKYYKGDAHAMPGMGLGLYLSKKIVTQHKGNITIHSGFNKGTQVKVTLPINGRRTA